MANRIGPNFYNELKAAGVAGLPFSWGADGTIEYGVAMTDAQKATVVAVLAAHDPTKPDTAADAAKAMQPTDTDMARVVEDLVAFVVAGTPLPQAVKDKINARRAVRGLPPLA